MFCTKCGSQIKDGYKFCPKCGTPAYVERENLQSELKKKEVEEVVEAKAIIDNGGTPTKKVKNVNKTKVSSNSKKTEKKSKSQNKSMPASLIAKELDIEGVKIKAENGDKDAMLRQAFRYEIGIGCETNKEKANSLYKELNSNSELLPTEELNYRSIIGVE